VALEAGSLGRREYMPMLLHTLELRHNPRGRHCSTILTCALPGILTQPALKQQLCPEGLACNGSRCGKRSDLQPTRRRTTVLLCQRRIGRGNRAVSHLALSPCPGRGSRSFISPSSQPPRFGRSLHATPTKKGTASILSTEHQRGT
jgi:hypothetical protein